MELKACFSATGVLTASVSWGAKAKKPTVPRKRVRSRSKRYPVDFFFTVSPKKISMIFCRDMEKGKMFHFFLSPSLRCFILTTSNEYLLNI
jgi:hypothetical protein